MSVSSSTLGNTRQKYKIVFLGDQSVGKSSIIERYITNSFEQSLNPTVGIDFYIKNVNRNNRQYRVQLWDTAGQQRFRSLIPSYMKDADCAIMVYDVTSKKSLENLTIWNNMFEQYKQINALKIVVGNKIDLVDQRQVSKGQGEKEALKYDSRHFQLSAKSGKKLDQVFMLTIDIITSKIQQRSKIYGTQQQIPQQDKMKTSQKKQFMDQSRINQKKIVQESIEIKKDPFSGKKLQPIKKPQKCCQI